MTMEITPLAATDGDDPAVEELLARRAARQERLVGGRALTALGRARRLVDEGTFRELFALRRSRGERGGDGDGVVVGVGRVDGRPVAVASHDFSHLGGSIGAVFAEKVARLQDLAIDHGFPIVYLNDSGGARIQEGIEALHGCGEVFTRNVRARGRVPQISVVLGPCAGAAAYSPALTDWTIMVREQGQMFLTGPEVVRAATGERVDPEDIGGALLHTRDSGVAHADVATEEEALALTRRLLALWPSHRGAAVPVTAPRDPEPAAAARLPGLVPLSPSAAFDMHELLAAVLDRGSWEPVMARHARSVLCGFARLDGIPVGVVASQPRAKGGVLDTTSSRKVARLVRFCGRFGLPVVTFVDVPGFLPGSAEEQRGVITAGAEMVAAYVEAEVPKLTVIVRKAYGGAYIAMGSRSLGADLTWAWAGSEIAVMGPAAAVGLLHRRALDAAEDPDALRAELTGRYREEVTRPWLAAERGIVDDVIAPDETRDRLVDGLRVLSPGLQPPRREATALRRVIDGRNA